MYAVYLLFYAIGGVVMSDIVISSQSSPSLLYDKEGTCCRLK